MATIFADQADPSPSRNGFPKEEIKEAIRADFSTTPIQE
jgi:hypothetical protein